MERGLRFVETERAPAPAGHYSQGAVAGGLIFISGQLPIRLDGTPAFEESFADQARLALNNMLAVLSAGGGRPSHLVRVTAYIVGIDNWAQFNLIFAEMLPDFRPARSVVPLAELHFGCLIEVEAIGLVAE